MKREPCLANDHLVAAWHAHVITKEGDDDDSDSLLLVQSV